MKRIYDKILSIDIEKEKEVDLIIKALDCANRRKILRLLSRKMMSISEISEILDIPISTISEHIKILINSGLVSIAGKKNSKGQSKLITRQYEKILISISNSENYNDLKSYSQNIPIGTYANFNINKYCGIVSEEGYIGARDDKNSFYAPSRFVAQLIWFDYGYLEYIVPIKNIAPRRFVSLVLSLELCSEAPGYNMNWKSDIYFEINGQEVCTYTSPSDFGIRRGILTPEWWQGGTQYGLIKQIEINRDGTFLDGDLVSNITIYDLNIESDNLLTFRIGVHEDAKNRGGINIFGRKFGDYNQNIILTLTYNN